MPQLSQQPSLMHRQSQLTLEWKSIEVQNQPTHFQNNIGDIQNFLRSIVPHCLGKEQKIISKEEQWIDELCKNRMNDALILLFVRFFIHHNIPPQSITQQNIIQLKIPRIPQISIDNECFFISQSLSPLIFCFVNFPFCRICFRLCPSEGNSLSLGLKKSSPNRYCPTPSTNGLFQIIMNKKLEIRSVGAVVAIGVTAGLSSFNLGYSHVYLSQMERLIQAKNEFSLQELALAITVVVSATNFGEIIGPFMYKQLVARSGEAKAMVFCNLVAIAAILVQLVELRVGYLLVGRVIQGAVIGILSCILPLYLNSIAPIPISGKICSLNQIMICLGVVAAYLVGFFIPEDGEDELLWRLVVGFPIIPSLACIIGFLWLFPFDSLERHLEKGENDPLERYLGLVYKNATVEDIRKEKVHESAGEVGAKYAHESERYILGMVVMASCQLCGINGIFYYAKQLLGEVTGGDVKLAQELMLGLAFCQGASSLICSRFVDLFGRKFLILKGQQILIGILMAIFAVDNLGDEMGIPGLSYLTVILIYAHVIIFNFSLGPVAVIYAAELVPNMTPMIVSLRTATFMVALSTNYIIHEFGIGQLFLLFGVLTAVAHTFLLRRLRETKGKSKPQIFQMFELDHDPEEKTGFL